VLVQSGLELILRRREGGGEIGALRVGLEPGQMVQPVCALECLADADLAWKSNGILLLRWFKTVGLSVPHSADEAKEASPRRFEQAMYRSEGSLATSRRVQWRSEAGVGRVAVESAVRAACWCGEETLIRLTAAQPSERPPPNREAVP
jgi:hypothetical protein